MDAGEYERTERAKCARKRRWERREQAERYIASPEAQGYMTRPLYSYRCCWCFGWHLTGTPQRERTA